MLVVRLGVSIVIATLASLIAPTATYAAQSAPEPEWSLDIDRIGAVETAGDAVIVAGKLGAYPFVSRYDRDGMEVWTRNFGSFGSRATALDITADGRIFVGTSRAQIYEFASNGDFVAAVAGPKLSSVTHLSVAADGSLYAAGNGDSNTGFTFDLAFLTRFDPDGVEQWTVDIDHGSTTQSEVRGMAALVDGSVVVVVDVMTRGSNPTVLRTSAAGYDSSSRRIWEIDDFWIHQDNVVPPLEGEERTTDVVAFPGGGFVAVGNRMGGTVNGSRDVVVRLTDSAGLERWTRELGDPDLQESSSALSVDEQGQIIVFGSVGPDAPTSSNQTALTFTAISHDGSVRWSANLDRQPGENSLGLASGSASDLFFASTVYKSLGGGTAYDHAFLRRLDAFGLDDQTVTCEATMQHPFLDLVEGSRVADDAGCLYGIGVTTGTSAATYGPDDLVTREQMAAFLARLQRRLTTAGCVVTLAYDEFPRGGESYVKLPFVDVGRSSFAFDDIGCIFANELTTGTSSTTYSPGDTITREQMAAFLARLYRLLTGDSCSAGATPFTDVSPTSFAAADITCIYSLGITTGTSATTYDPGSSVTRGQMASFLARLYRGVI